MTFFQLARHLRDLRAESEVERAEEVPAEPVPRSAMLLNPTLAHGELGSRERRDGNALIPSPEPAVRRAADFEGLREDPEVEDPGINDNEPADRAMA